MNAASHDPWIRLLEEYGPFLAQNAESVVARHPEFDPAGLILGPDEAHGPTGQSLAAATPVQFPELAPQGVITMTLPRETVAVMLEQGFAGDADHLPSGREGSLRILPVIALTLGRAAAAGYWYDTARYARRPLTSGSPATGAN